METLKLIYLAAGPGIALAVYIYYSDKWDLEPKRLVAASFFLGGLACFPSSYFEGAFQTVFGLEGILTGQPFTWWQKAFYAFFGVALVEELCKFLFLKGFIFDDREFNEPFDGIVYGGIVGCGFATVENLMYILPGGYEVGILRMLTAVPGHVFGGVILGYFMGKAKFCPNPNKNLLSGLGLVIVIHGLYDTAAFLNVRWSIYLVFLMVFIGIYLGLNAKRKLAKHSSYVASSSKNYFILKNGKKHGPFNLIDIRESLADGSLDLEDVLLGKKSGEKTPIRELLCAEIALGMKKKIKIPPTGQPVNYFLIFYGLTFGFYLYFWFHRTCRNFRAHKNLNLNPELRTLSFFVFTIIPFYIYGDVLRGLEKNIFDPAIFIPFNFFMACVETVFLFVLLRMIKGFLDEKMKKSFPLFMIVLMFFVLSVTRKLLPTDLSYYLFFEMTLIMLQGGVLAFVQKDINNYWKLGKRTLENSA